jgi:aminomethyltransferase
VFSWLAFFSRFRGVTIIAVMPIGTAVHERTFALCESLNYREWSGYYAVSAYEAHHEHEYNAIRNAAALIDVSPLFKYLVTGRDAVTLVDRVITRDARALVNGQVYYTPWCDERGKVIDDGTVTRLAEDRFRWTAADPSLRWLTQNAARLEVLIEDISEQVAALALQGPTSGRLLNAVADADIRNLKYFRMTSGSIAGVPVDISRTGYTGDLGYEIWVAWDRAVEVWDALIASGRPFDIRPAGMLALDVARVEAGLLLVDVDFHSSKKALIDAQTYSPFEMGLGRLVQLEAGTFVGRQALVDEARAGWKRQVVGLEIDWPSIEQLYEHLGMAPQIAAAASRVAVPVYKNGDQVGRATTTTWSPVLKKLIALATIDAPYFDEGTPLDFEITIEAVRQLVPARVVKTPFFNPKRKTALPL